MQAVIQTGQSVINSIANSSRPSLSVNSNVDALRISSQTAVSTPVTTQSITIPQVQAGSFSPTIYFSKSAAIPGSPRPNNAPTGTKPIDSAGLPREAIHEIKKSIGARSNDWTGIAPNGDIITGTRDGEAINNGPADDHTSRPTGLVK